MVALANRVEANILIDPKPEAKNSKKDSTVKTTKTSSPSSPGDPDSNYEIRDLRIFGKVSLHQDPYPGKTKGKDAFGETLILHNEGPGKAIFNLYHKIRWPGKSAQPAVALATPCPWPRSSPKT